MKKLLYTLLIGLVVVSCQKEEYGGDYAPNALSTDNEISIKQKWENVVSLISGYEFSKEEMNRISTRKGGDNGVNWIEVVYFTGSDNNGYAYLRPDNLGVGCYDNIEEGISAAEILTLTLIDNSGVLELNVQEEDEATANTFQAPVPAGTSFSFGLFFGNTESSLLFAENTFLGWNPTAGNLPTNTYTD